MPVKVIPKFSKAQITKELKRRRDIIFDRILIRLQAVGEEIINSARIGGSYKDQEGNLRSSIGYVILYNGLQLVEAGFQQIKAGSEGVTVGKNVVREMASKYPTGFVLVAVAGMVYASAVESKNYSVLTPFANDAAQKLAKSMKELIKKLKTEPLNL